MLLKNVWGICWICPLQTLIKTPSNTEQGFHNYMQSWRKNTPPLLFPPRIAHVKCAYSSSSQYTHRHSRQSSRTLSLVVGRQICSFWLRRLWSFLLSSSASSAWKLRREDAQFLVVVDIVTWTEGEGKGNAQERGRRRRREGGEIKRRKPNQRHKSVRTVLSRLCQYGSGMEWNGSIESRRKLLPPNIYIFRCLCTVLNLNT